MLKVALVVGTRPEAIKMAPIAIAIKKNRKMKPLLILTAQHRRMCDDVLEVFSLTPDYDLDIMKPRQSLFEVTARLARKLEPVLAGERPDIVLVQGDTTSTFMGSLCSYYLRIPVGHVEAGLRTYHKYSPFPEEINRKLTTAASDLHFAPTRVAKAALVKEGVRRDDDICTHCGMCISICPTKALSLDPKTGKVTFTEEKCVACGVCIDACPPRAMEILI